VLGVAVYKTWRLIGLRQRTFLQSAGAAPQQFRRSVLSARGTAMLTGSPMLTPPQTRDGEFSGIDF
jgi:hypothetical protein